MSNHFHPPPELRLDPLLATPGVPLVDPELLDARELSFGTFQQQPHAGTILDLRGVHLGSKAISRCTN